MQGSLRATRHSCSKDMQEGEAWLWGQEDSHFQLPIDKIKSLN